MTTFVLHEVTLGSGYRCVSGHDARTCAPCLRAGVHTLVASPAQFHAEFAAEEPDTFAVAVETVSSGTDAATATSPATAAASAAAGALLPQPRWLLFADESPAVRAEDSSQMLVLTGAEPRPPLRRAVARYPFARASAVDAESVVLVPVALALGGAGGSVGAFMTGSAGGDVLEAAATALGELVDLCELAACDRALFLLQGLCIVLRGGVYFVSETVPAGCVVRLCDATHVDIADPPPPPHASPSFRNAASPPRLIGDASIGSVGRGARPRRPLADSATSPVAFTPPTSSYRSMVHGLQPQAATTILPASPELSPLLSPSQQQAEAASRADNVAASSDVQAPLSSWSQRLADLQRVWSARLSPHFETPHDLVSAICELAVACRKLQAINNDVAVFVSRFNARGSPLLYAQPDEALPSLGPAGTDDGDVVLVLHPDAEQVALALELRDVRVSESWACASASCVYAAVPASSRVTLQRVLTRTHAARDGSGHAAASAAGAGSLMVLGEPRHLTRLRHSALDDLHRMLEWHDAEVERLFARVSRQVQPAGSTSNDGGVDWQFVMDVWGLQLAELVRDVRLEADQIVDRTEASNSAFLQVEQALEDFRADEHRSRSALAQDSVVHHNYSVVTTAGANEAPAVVAADHAAAKQRLANVLTAFSNAVAHEVAGDADACAKHEILLLWGTFEALGAAYELVVGRVSAFRRKLLASPILDSAEVRDGSLRACYQDAVARLRAHAAAHADRRRSTIRVHAEAEAAAPVRAALDRLVDAAGEVDVFAGVPIGELWSSGARSFSEFLHKMEMAGFGFGNCD